MKDLNPNWKPFELHADDVCGLDAEFSILVWDWDRLSKFFFFLLLLLLFIILLIFNYFL